VGRKQLKVQDIDTVSSQRTKNNNIKYEENILGTMIFPEPGEKKHHQRRTCYTVINIGGFGGFRW
jgi:hypothetical protein